MNDAQQGHEESSLTYHHALYEDRQHWFSAEHDGDEVAHAHVIERPGPGGPHIEIKALWTNPHERGRGIGTHLLDQVSEHFTGQELRLKPYPIDEDSGQDKDELREYYRNRGFSDYQVKEGDPFELYGYMTKRAAPGSAIEPASSFSTPDSEAHLAGTDFPAPPATRAQDSKPNIPASIRRSPPVAGLRRRYGPLSPGRQGGSRLRKDMRR